MKIPGHTKECVRDILLFYAAPAVGAFFGYGAATAHKALFAGGAAVENIGLCKSAQEKSGAEIEKHGVLGEQVAHDGRKAAKAQHQQHLLAQTVIHQPSTTRL